MINQRDTGAGRRLGLGFATKVDDPVRRFEADRPLFDSIARPDDSERPDGGCQAEQASCMGWRDRLRHPL
ncbi:hypothetical protein [Nocardia puris]|uniref:hypothetical protein n=1 Tax=Nocardia puris TaxID=208602 RepID=UPI0008347808|nr:hypothetical protein [Nocardia puris]